MKNGSSTQEESEKKESIRDFCTLLPKVELHAHINGSIRDSTLLELMKAQNPSSDAIGFLQTKVGPNDSRSLSDCFKLFGFIHAAVTTTDVVTRITRECIEDFCAENVKYVELRTTPKRSGNFTARNYINAVVQGIQECRDKQLDCVVKLLLSIDRSQVRDIAESISI
jgi:adenosine deaminase